MPREPRIYIENALYFITAKGDEDRDLFSDSQDFNSYLKSLKEYKQEYGFKLFAFALLPKSLCLLIELRNNVTISTIMHDLNSRYTKSYNSRYGKKGHLFQSRFKSVLVQKDDYLLRLSRYIHLLPKGFGMVDGPARYPYSSCALYLSKNSSKADHVILTNRDVCLSSDSNIEENTTGHQNDGIFPDMSHEISEVLGQFTRTETDADRCHAYENYLKEADDQEVNRVRKLLHRKAFVGSNDFIKTVKNEIEHHIIEEEESRTIRKTNPAFVFAGSLIILFLATVAYNFHNNQSSLQQTLNITATGFETAREDLASRVFNLQNEITGFQERENHGLGGLAWELQFLPVEQGSPAESFTDQLSFKGGKVISSGLLARGFLPFDYTISKETHGKMIWKTVQTNAEGLTVRWYGIVAGDQMRGVLSERPVQGENRDFAFVSLRRVKEPGRPEYAIQ